jgi:hypothetical protein
MKNLFPNEAEKSSFKQIRKFLCVALTSQPMLYFNTESSNISQILLDWMDEVTGNKAFEYANKYIN